MNKTIIYALDALNPDALPEIIEDIQNETINKIIVPDFLLKNSYTTYGIQNLKNVVNVLKLSSKVVFKTFPTCYEKNQCPNTFTYLILFATNMLKEYRNVYIKTREPSSIIELLKRDFKIFLREEEKFETIFNNYITEENSIKPTTSTVFIDTCYYVNIFHTHNGLNILKDINTQKLILSASLYELINIKETEIFEFLVYLINNKKLYNIKFIVTVNPYDKVYACNDLMMLTYIVECTKSKNLTVYTSDLMFAMQCIYQNINVGDIPSAINENNIDIIENVSFQNKPKEVPQNEEIIVNKNDNIIELPIIMKYNIAYLSTKLAPKVYTDIISGMYSNIYGKNGQTKYYQVRPGWYAELSNNNKIYLIKGIDRQKLIVKLEKTSLSI